MTNEASRFLVREVHNFGGFFGGDTVTLTAVRPEAPDAEIGLTIDQQALANVRDRHTICAGMLLELTMAGERVDRAELLGAASHTELRAALGPAKLDAPVAGPHILSYYCEPCGLWLAGAPNQGSCRLCGTPLGLG